MSAPSVERTFAVVVNWNGGDGNCDCLESLVRSGLAPDRIVFVDNASTDGSREAVTAAFTGLRVIENAANLGFGEGANQGARAALEAGAEAVFFVNNDVTLPSGTLVRLVEILGEQDQRGVVGPRVLYADPPDRVWCAGGMLTWRQNLSTLRGHRQLDGPSWRANRPVDYIAGCAMLVRREVFERVGFFEAAYFAYMEDVEYCLRVREVGFGVFLAGEVACHHAPSSATGGGYSPRRKYMQGVNSIHFLRSHGGSVQWLRFVLFDVLTLPALLTTGLFSGRAKGAAAKALGIWHGLQGRRVVAPYLEPGASRLW